MKSHIIGIGKEPRCILVEKVKHYARDLIDDDVGSRENWIDVIQNHTHYSPRQNKPSLKDTRTNAYGRPFKIRIDSLDDQKYVEFQTLLRQEITNHASSRSINLEIDNEIGLDKSLEGLIFYNAGEPDLVAQGLGIGVSMDNRALDETNKSLNVLLVDKEALFFYLYFMEKLEKKSNLNFMINKIFDSTYYSDKPLDVFLADYFAIPNWNKKFHKVLSSITSKEVNKVRWLASRKDLLESSSNGTSLKFHFSPDFRTYSPLCNAEFLYYETDGSDYLEIRSNIKRMKTNFGSIHINKTDCYATPIGIFLQVHNDLLNFSESKKMINV
nr:hypothetical protein [Candidatus Woesearchaeota archaeon]